MKKYIIICAVVVFILCGIYYLNFYTSLYINFSKKVSTDITITDKIIKLNDKEFNIKGMNIASSLPMHDNKDYPISKEIYLTWFEEIQAMNCNTVRIYNIESPDFYNALYEYNNGNNKPLYLIQGVDFGDYEENSSVDYFDDSLLNKLKKDVKIMVDVIHGKRIISTNTDYSSGFYNKDVSKWTLGFIIGTEWNDVTIEYTNKEHKNDTIYNGKYLKTKKSSTPFERILCEIGDTLFSYETERYNSQRLLSFGNYPQTDPFDYDEAVSDLFNKFSKVDIENLTTTKKVKSGMFVSFQAYSGYPDYYSLTEEEYGDSYKEYLDRLNNHYTMPVVISEFGYSTARGETINYFNDNYGNSSLTEEEQGKMIKKSINTFKEVGINSFIIYEWQDEWDNNVWNTMHSKDVARSQYWHDVQTTTASYGLLAFDTGKKNDLVYVDGKTKEWNKNNMVTKNQDYTLFSKYDSEYLYLMINKKNLDFKNDTIYIPIDTTTKSGSKYDENENISFNRNVDFVIKINGKDNSKITVQEYYNTLSAIYGKKINHKEPFEKDHIPTKNSNKFNNIEMITSTQNLVRNNSSYEVENVAKVIDTSKLVYGNSNHNSKNYNSLGDFYSTGDNIEIRIAWGLLNFSDPSLMMIHDDYYEKYGVESYHINKMYLGIGNNETIKLTEFGLSNWDKKLEFHERLKKSYYILQDALKDGE